MLKLKKPKTEITTEFLGHYTTTEDVKYFRSWRIYGLTATKIGISYLSRDNRSDGNFLTDDGYADIMDRLAIKGLKSATNTDYAKALLLGFKK